MTKNGGQKQRVLSHLVFLQIVKFIALKKKKNRKMNNQKEEKNNGVSCFLEVKCFNQELLGVFF